MKKFQQWLTGFVIVVVGGYICFLGYGAVKTFINMMEQTGKEFVANFSLFIICILAVVFLPYAVFHIIKDGVKEELK